MSEDEPKTLSFRIALGEFTNLDAGQIEKLRRRRAVIELGRDGPPTVDDPRDSAYPSAGGFGRILTP